MTINIRVHLAEKRSSSSQYENFTIGADIEAQGLELRSAEEIQRKTLELFQLARGALQTQLLEPLPSAATKGREHNGGTGRANANGNGNRRRPSHGRPRPEPTAKQKQLLQRLARERNLDAETVGQICERLVGVPLRSCTRDDLSKLIDALLEEAA